MKFWWFYEFDYQDPAIIAKLFNYFCGSEVKKWIVKLEINNLNN